LLSLILVILILVILIIYVIIVKIMSKYTLNCIMQKRQLHFIYYKVKRDKMVNRKDT